MSIEEGKVEENQKEERRTRGMTKDEKEVEEHRMRSRRKVLRKR